MVGKLVTLAIARSLVAEASSRLSDEADSRCDANSTQGLALLQSRHRQRPESVVTKSLFQEHQRSLADDARFLIQATFGPMRQSMDQLGRISSYEEWIQKQMRPYMLSSHRAHFRERVNPPYEPASMPLFRAVGRCEKGSRWVDYVFTRFQENMQVSIGNVIQVAGQWVSGIDQSLSETTCTNEKLLDWRFTCTQRRWWILPRCREKPEDWMASKVCQQSCFDYGFPYAEDDCSGGWGQYRSNPFDGYVCKVQEGVGGLVQLSKHRSCKDQDVVYVRNPAIHRASGDPFSELPASALAPSPLVPGPRFLAETAGQSACAWRGHGLVASGDALLRLDPRMALEANLPESPRLLHDGSCVARSFLNEGDCEVLPQGDTGCFQACGSFGEVATDGSKGYQRAMTTKFRIRSNRRLDNRYRGRQNDDQGKTQTWTELALGAEDQLRQRTAWALSQIYVVGVFNRESEMWMAYYDIFVRNAFGSLRDLLREVTYSPLMGQYLTYRGGRSLDTSSSYADENYAREIMQLFTIGLTTLHANGSAVRQNLMEVPTYSNENIQDFARVFTGFNKLAMRGNMEQAVLGNMVDPMSMEGRFHDIYPKPDLYGGFLGDGYPLCRELPTRAFLEKGARYEFLGYSHQGHFLELDPASGLYEALCGESAGTCAFAAVVALRRQIRCHDTECEVSSLSVVKVGAGYYDYARPPCVFTFFFNGKQAERPQAWNRGTCVDPLLPLAGMACCAGSGGSGASASAHACSNTPSRPMERRGHTCVNAQQHWLNKGKPVMSSMFCKKNKDWRRRKYCQLECFKLGVGYEGDECEDSGPGEKLACSNPTQHMSFEAAGNACQAAGLRICEARNVACDGSMYVWKGGDCKIPLKVYADGKVSAYTGRSGNRFRVPWTGAAAPAGSYEFTVEETAVFTGSTVPTAQDVRSNLTIGAFKPIGTPTAEAGGVKVYSPSANMDLTTVFECDGKFYQNIRSLVHLQADAAMYTFRNPPAFIRPGPLKQMGDDLNRAALAEVESLLDHLFYHPNTGMFVGKKLAQRFVTSNPSAEYLTAIAEAFKTGTYSGVTYGEYGSLGATVAAILLHPEARGDESETNGLLREPMLKILHFMRSMQYTDDFGEYVSFAQLGDVIGQFPYHSPTVFNFFDAEFMPSRFAAEAEPEPEAESDEPEEGLVAPEFQIFTPPFAIGLLNGMSSLLRHGVSSCDDGFGNRDNAGGCRRGTLQFVGTSEEETLSELNLLLTGGRLTPLDAAAVKAAYDAPPEGSPLQAAQQAILFMPEFHNLGEPLPAGTRPAPAPAPESEFKDYKAVVMLFLAGGADTFHMLVPINCPLYNEYREIRGGAAHSQTELHPILSNNNKNCRDFGIHPEMSFIAELYNNPGKKHGDWPPAAFVSNIGALVEPVNKWSLGSPAKQKCRGLYSHSHQQQAAQTLQCQLPGAIPKGVGGRMADMLASQYKVESFSITGTATWSEGFDTQTDIISSSKGVLRLSNYNLWGNFIANITRQTHGNVYCEEYAEAFADAIASSEKLGREVEGVDLETVYEAKTKLQQQLYQVARLIKAHPDRGAERDFFFVQTGGWDHHSGLLEGFASNIREVDRAIKGFVEELEQQGNFAKTVLLTASDFGRTLTFNGQGTDHGWGGNHMVIGGSIQGGKIFNKFPSSLDPASSEYLTDRGRVIPEYPWENVMLPVAEWLGIREPDLSTVVFPNLGNFNRSRHIIPCTLLFGDGACQEEV